MEYYKNLDLNDIVYFCEFDLISKTELWKDVINYENIYKVSDLGRIKSLKKIELKNGKHPFIKKERILKQTKTQFGYLKTSIFLNSKQSTFFMHRLVALSFIENTENKRQVNHKNGVKKDNRVCNLEWNTSFENMKHASENDLLNVVQGEDHYNAKLNEKQILEIRNSNLKQKNLCEIYNVSQSLISAIKKKKVWKSLI